ncbi:inositol monophosphatase family protein [Oceanibacterium hippocampi]|uniref:Inositol-1-monophosphatase n=1 Tax=Oceanibacterium hippocampi TaxID=745714 RepID=A0A1Y5U0W7_9PROT|nr:inositol monophosphatase family protein [Oceanibacterium hippocampi]SLN73505.1 Inositol-1-monophosphatase [Oceanibacterium hippocampi]
MNRKSALINVMEAAARRASRALLRDFNEVEHLQVSRKGPADFVSAADLRAEETLRRELGKARPSFGFRGEEGEDVAAPDGQSYWIVDPLDGTTNFLHGIPHFAISIGVEVRGEIVAGLILEPTRDELFFAEKGQGAFMNGRRLRVSARAKLPEALLATGIPFLGRDGHDRFSAELNHVMDKVAGIRRFGSAALDLAYVAAGRYEAFWERGLSPWDIAAGIILVREAGGMVSQLDGGEKMMEKGDILAANSELYDSVARLLREARKS